MGRMGQAQPTMKEQIRENKRGINKAIRELDRERLALERQQTVRTLRGKAREWAAGSPSSGTRCIEVLVRHPHLLCLIHSVHFAYLPAQ